MDTKSYKLDIKSLRNLSILKNLLNNIRFKNRYSLKEFEKKYLSVFFEFIETHCIQDIPKKKEFFRVREHPLDFDKYRCIEKSKMFAPPSNKAIGGRLNPAGIPYLYLSFEEETALSEKRPWINAGLTIGVFHLKKDLKVVDVTSRPDSSNVSPEFQSFCFSWINEIDYRFSIPTQREEIGVYSPTQFLSELIKEKGYDGIKYRSSTNPKGSNLAMFDKSKATCVRRYKLEVHSIKYKYDYASFNPDL